MNSYQKHQLMTVDQFGNERPILESPGKPIELFERTHEAHEWAKSHAQKFPHGVYCIKTVFVLEAEEAAAKENIETGEQVAA